MWSASARKKIRAILARKYWKEATASCMSPREHLARCDRDQCDQQCDYGWVLFNTSGEHDIWSEHSY